MLQKSEGLNKPEQYILAIVEVDCDRPTHCYIHLPFTSEPDYCYLP